MLNRQNADVRRLWTERRAFIKIITEYRKQLGDSPMAHVQIDTSYESPDNLSPDYAPWDTSNLSETCRNYMLVRDSILKNMQVLSQQENQRKREQALDTSLKKIHHQK